MLVINPEDLMPDCMLPDCVRSPLEGRHAHVLPHQLIALESTAKYFYVQGGVGSAKSAGLAARCVRLSLEVDENEGVVGRKDYGDLFRSSWKDVKACIKKLVRLRYFDAWGIDLLNYEKKLFSSKKQGDYTVIKFPNGSSIYAMQTKAWEEALGASYGFFWIDDAMESSEELFVGHETSAGIISRLRLPMANFYRDAEGTVTSKLVGLVSSNPPPSNHWLHKLFGAEPGLFKIGTNTVHHQRVETFLNPFVGDDYAVGLISIQSKMGRSADTARRVIYGESRPSYGGIPVYSQFKNAVHVCDTAYDRTLPLIRSWDFGLHHPAVIINQLWRCVQGRNHFLTLSEVVHLFEIDVYDLWAEVKQHCKECYPDHRQVFDAGDKSGYRNLPNRKDKRSDIKILQAEFGLTFKYKFFDLDTSIKYCRRMLSEPCKCGLPIIQVHRDAVALIEALEGGYKYSKNKQGIVSDKPIKDKFYDDIADAWRYGVENYLKTGVTYRDSVNPGYKKHKPSPERASWDWLNADSEEIAMHLSNT